jgi:hypothetical protein
VSANWYESPRDAQGDKVWEDARRRNLIGERCALPGPFIEGLLLSSPDDACAVCPVSERTRAKCMGRPEQAQRVVDKPPKLDVPVEGSTANLKMLRALRVRELEGPFGRRKK